MRPSRTGFATTEPHKNPNRFTVRKTSGSSGGRRAVADRGLADLAVGTPVGVRWRVEYARGGPGWWVPAGAGGTEGVWGSGVVDVLRHRLVVPWSTRAGWSGSPAAGSTTTTRPSQSG